MQTYPLIAHRGAPPIAVSGVTARVFADHPYWLRLRWKIAGPTSLLIPPFAGRSRADGLWKTTCFEAFIQSEGSSAYIEANFSPSEEWALYRFTQQREGMANQPSPYPPVCTWRGGSREAIFDAALPWSALPGGPYRLGLTAVLEEEGGHKSYWALGHDEGGNGSAPDFHNPACFTARLAAPRQPSKTA